MEDIVNMYSYLIILVIYLHSPTLAIIIIIIIIITALSFSLYLLPPQQTSHPSSMDQLHCTSPQLRPERRPFHHTETIRLLERAQTRQPSAKKKKKKKKV